MKTPNQTTVYVLTKNDDGNTHTEVFFSEKDALLRKEELLKQISLDPNISLSSSYATTSLFEEELYESYWIRIIVEPKIVK